MGVGSIIGLGRAKNRNAVFRKPQQARSDPIRSLEVPLRRGGRRQSPGSEGGGVIGRCVSQPGDGCLSQLSSGMECQWELRMGHFCLS